MSNDQDAPTSKSMEALLLQTGRLFSISPLVRAGARKYQGPVAPLLPPEGSSKTLGTTVVQQTEAVQQTPLSEGSKVNTSAGLPHSLPLLHPTSQIFGKEDLRPSASLIPRHSSDQVISMTDTNPVAPKLAPPMPLVSDGGGDLTPADNGPATYGQPAVAQPAIADEDIATPDTESAVPDDEAATPIKATSKKRKNRKRKKAAPKNGANKDGASQDGASKGGASKDDVPNNNIPNNAKAQGLSQPGSNITLSTDKAAVKVIKDQLLHFRANAIAQFLGRVKTLLWVNEDIKKILEDTPVARKVLMVIAHTDYKAVGPSMRMLHDTTMEVRTKTPYNFSQTREHLVDALFEAFTWEDEAKGKHLVRKLIYELFKWDGR